MSLFIRLCLLLVPFIVTPQFAYSADTVNMITGPKTGTYIQFGKNIADVSSQSQQNVRVLESNGSIDNIRRIVESKGDIALGIVQSDILSFMRRSNNAHTRKIADHLSLIFPFYEEEVHILARKNIYGLRDLGGKRVVVGEQGSGNMLTAINILSLANIEAGEILHMDPAQGVAAVISGEADALISVGGKPVPLFSNLSSLRNSKDKKTANLLNNVHLVPIDDQRVYNEYAPTRIMPGDYPFVKETVLTATVTALLVAYDDKKKGIAHNKKYCKPLQQVSRAIESNMSALQRAGHKKWKEVDLYENITMWDRNRCVWDGKRFIAGSTSSKKQEALTSDLLDILRNGQ